MRQTSYVRPSGRRTSPAREVAASADVGDAIEATERASLHDFVSTLPEGYDTMVGNLATRCRMGGGKTVGFVSHRASTMALADAIVEADSSRTS